MSTQNTNDLFVTAARKKMRFESTRGSLTVEDLFDLSLPSLDAIAVSIDEQIQKAGRKSFIATKKAATSDLDAQLAIVMFAIETKMAEAEAKKVRAEKASQRTFLKSLLEKKKIDALENLSLEEIQKQLDAVEA